VTKDSSRLESFDIGEAGNAVVALAERVLGFGDVDADALFTGSRDHREVRGARERYPALAQRSRHSVTSKGGGVVSANEEDARSSRTGEVGERAVHLSQHMVERLGLIGWAEQIPGNEQDLWARLWMEVVEEFSR
jgi:hypothetical protein